MWPPEYGTQPLGLGRRVRERHVVVVADIGEQQAARRAVHDQADIVVNADRPEVGVLGAVQLVDAQAGCGGVELQVERGGLHSFLFLSGQAREAAGEGVGDQEFHDAYTNAEGSCRQQAE